MIGYYERHGMKQFIRAISIKFRFKMRAAADQFVIHIELYGGNSPLTEIDLGQGDNVAIWI